MIHVAGRPEDLVVSYRLLSLTSCLGKRLEKAVAYNLRNRSFEDKRCDEKTYHNYCCIEEIKNQ